MPSRALVAIRDSGLAKAFATLLVALVLSPLTAPFSTFDLAEIIGETSIHVDTGASKLAKEVIDVAMTAPRASPSLNAVWCQTAASPGSPAFEITGPLVLRI